MKKFIPLIIVLLLTCCSPETPLEVSGEKHIIAHTMDGFNDQIDGSGWLIGSTVTLEIDDPDIGSGVDYTDSQEAQVTEAENISIQFFLGVDWDLQPGNIITLSDGDTTVTHVVQFLRVEDIDLEADLIQGLAKPESEVIVWIESPATCELRVMANASGQWTADFSGIADITEEFTGAIAQNDALSTGSSHTRIDWDAGDYATST